MANQPAFELHRPWKEVVERIKEQEISLSDEDLTYTPGSEQQLLERLAGKLHKTPDAVREWIERLSANTAQAG